MTTKRDDIDAAAKRADGSDRSITHGSMKIQAAISPSLSLIRTA
jgi:hypothetical protein